MLIGVVEYGAATLGDNKTLKLNPGTNYRLAKDFDHRRTTGVFISPSISTIMQKFFVPDTDDAHLISKT